ncbi:MAG TPA: CAP domain-containing protein [Herpetosiphonaceae bacterium]
MTVRPCAQLSKLALSALVLAAALFNVPATSASPDLNRVIELTNEHRRAAGCANLTWQPALGAAAQRHAEDMAANNYFSHTSRNGASFGTRIRQAGYRYRLAAENIAAGYQSPEEVVNGWMASPGHRANILNCRLRNVGIGFGENGGSAYGTYWVQDFGTAR